MSARVGAARATRRGTPALAIGAGGSRRSGSPRLAPGVWKSRQFVAESGVRFSGREAAPHEKPALSSVQTAPDVLHKQNNYKSLIDRTMRKYFNSFSVRGFIPPWVTLVAGSDLARPWPARWLGIFPHRRRDPRNTQ